MEKNKEFYSIIKKVKQIAVRNNMKYYEKYGFVKFNYVKKIPILNLFKKNFDIKIANNN